MRKKETQRSATTSAARAEDLRWLVDVVVIVVQLLFAVAIAMQLLEIGSEQGAWIYPYKWPLPVWAIPLGVAAVLASVALPSIIRAIEKRQGIVFEAILVVATVVIGSLLALMFRWLYPHAIANIISSDVANGFYTASRRVEAGPLLRDFEATVRLLPRHVQSNLPGKVLFFRALGMVSVDPKFLGIVVVFIANLSAAIVYVIARMLRADIATAWLAGLFAILTPANIFFQPILNTVSPIPILLALALFIGALTRGLIAGAVLFFAFLFDPLTFALGTIFVALLWWRVREGHDVQQALTLAALTFAGFAVTAIATRIVFGFDVVKEFRFVGADAVIFNQIANRQYAVWVFANMKEYAVGAGVASTSLLALMFFRQWKIVISTESLIGAVAVAWAIAILSLDLMGINRGEITRLWIFLTPVQAMLVAYACRRWGSRWTPSVVVGGMLLQVSLTIGTISFVNP